MLLLDCLILVLMNTDIKMADITMCFDKTCPAKLSCYRHTATPGEFQSYFAESPLIATKEGFECDMFWGEEDDEIWEQLNRIMNGEDV